MQFENFSFGSLRIDGSTYEHDVIIDRGEIRKRQKKPSKKFREDWTHPALCRGGHTLEVRPPRGRHWRVRRVASDERSAAGSRTTQC
jgi:hypothetical protein